jgi:hypothetical protein
MNRRTRNILCLWIIFIGLANFVGYTVMYGYIGGDAKNGEVRDQKFYVRGHFIHANHVSSYPNGTDNESEVSKRMWIYSYIHSITILPTAAAIIICTLLLARPHIIATMREGFVSGQTLVTVFITVLVLIVGAATAWFVLDFIHTLSKAGT